MRRDGTVGVATRGNGRIQVGARVAEHVSSVENEFYSESIVVSMASIAVLTDAAAVDRQEEPE